ncbi:MAG: aminotransferase class III-fold pyridoxal phosphate-dependent enzyme [Proteobacteria bacterium]|nr:aminotransferase class III-fold pyridoxal phosphate-dependent enzyme [Pseudomonadota bacterium]MBU1738778.1 aminotransferase class III-fold pyridoxal phosphate-dependent enzyme [Pseudomonadota bacterium]
MSLSLGLSKRYEKSEALLKRAERCIPLGTQTFSKSYLQSPRGVSPQFLTKGKGARVWDVDGNEYVDMVCGLLPVILGYSDPDVDQAIRDQLARGISFSLATELEIQLAEKLTEILPCAEMVRFGKNGSDATSAAVRLARAVTGRDRIACCGYHGWQDWYIGTTVRNKGIPDAVCKLTHRFPYNDLDALERLLVSHPKQFAAVIMEPMNVDWPAESYLPGVRELAHKHGALFVLDEIISGFRFAMGGAQELFGVIPDLAAFGKSMGNGMPISVIAGKAEYMRVMEDIFFSFTFGGEALSLAAALAVIDKLEREDGIARLRMKGERLNDGVRDLIQEVKMQDYIQLKGHPSWTIIEFSDHPLASKEAMKTLFILEMQKQGVLIRSSHNICLALTEEDETHVVSAWEKFLLVLAEELDKKHDIPLENRLGCDLVRPVFSVR